MFIINKIECKSSELSLPLRSALKLSKTRLPSKVSMPMLILSSRRTEPLTTRTTHRQKRTGKSVNKYESIINKDVYKKHQLYGDMVWERIMGQSEEKAKFEKAMDSYKHAKEGKFGRGRLGVDY